jgi:hypothetical protein
MDVLLYIYMCIYISYAITLIEFINGQYYTYIYMPVFMVEIPVPIPAHISSILLRTRIPDSPEVSAPRAGKTHHMSALRGRLEDTATT